MNSAFPSALLAGEGEPAVRASHLQLWLSTARSSRSVECSAFLDKLPGPLVQEIKQLASPTWLKMEHDVRFADLMREALGEDAVHRFYIDLTLASLAGPTLRPLVQGAIRLSGKKPDVAVTWWPRGWKGLFRDCGTLTGQVIGPGHARLNYGDLPRVCAGSKAWFDSLRSSAQALLVLCRVEGEIRMNADASLRRAQLDLHWV